MMTQFILSQLIGISATLAWSANTETDIAGYTVYVGEASRAYPINFDAGNALTFQIKGLNPGRNYYFAVTARNTSGLASVYSSEVVAATPPMNLNLSMGSDAVLTVNCFDGGTFDIESSADLLNWTTTKTFFAEANVYKIHVNLTDPMKFFRAKKVADSTPYGAAVIVATDRTQGPPGGQPPLPPQKVSILKKIGLFFKYRPGMHPGEMKKGAEVLMSKPSSK